jgi:hypothetical protein
MKPRLLAETKCEVCAETRGAFRVPDHGADIEGGLLATPRDVDRGFHRNVPGMEEIQIHGFLRQQFRLGQAGAVVLGGEARDRQRRLDRGPHRRRREIRTAGMAAPLADVGGDAESLVAVVLDGLDLLPAHADRLAESFRDIHLAGGGAHGGSVVEHGLRQRAQCLLGVGKTLGHAGTLQSVDADAKL